MIKNRHNIAMICCLVCWIAVFVLGSSGDYDPEWIVGVWLFEDGKLDDSSGNGHDGNFTGGNVKTVKGQFGGALEFVAGGSHAAIPDDAAFSTTSFTAMAWINVPAPSGDWQWIIAQNGTWPDRHFVVGISKMTLPLKADRGPELVGEPGSIHYALLADDRNSELLFNTPIMVADGKWHHIAATYDKSICRVYIDGELDAEMKWNMDLLDSTADVTIGGPNLTGVVDEVLIANQAFSQDIIKRIMELGLEEFLIVGEAVSASGKLTSTWGNIRLETAD